IPEGPVVHVDNRAGRRFTLRSDNNAPLSVPLVALVNEATASAAEILAGAIKDREVGLIVGTTTFGKGLVQRIWPLDQGAGVKLTVQRWYTPDGHSISRKPDPESPEEAAGGIHPDIEVAWNDQGVFGDVESDVQLQAAIRE